ASMTTHSTPPCASAFATVSPAIPAPTTTTRSTGPVTPPRTSARPSSKFPAVNPDTPRVGEFAHVTSGETGGRGGAPARAGQARRSGASPPQGRNGPCQVKRSRDEVTPAGAAPGRPRGHSRPG